MRVVMLSWRGPSHPRRGGAEVYTLRVLAGLVERGHEVSWYSAGYSGLKPSEVSGIRLYYGWRGLWVYLSGHRWLRKQDVGNYDLVIDQINTFGFGAPQTKHQTVCLIHQLATDVWDAEVHWPMNVIGRWLERRVLRLYSDVPFMTMCQSTIDEMHEWGWRGIGMVTPTGIDKIFNVPKARVPVLSFLGRFDAKAKRLDHALAIHQRVMESYPDCELWVIGRGKVPRQLVNQENVKVLANVNDDERDHALGTAWCCIATSVREGWGRMVTESGAARTPTVGYDVPGLRDSILDGQTGMLVAESIDDAASAIISLLQRPEELSRLGDNAQFVAGSVTWKTSVDRFEEALLFVSGGSAAACSPHS